MSGRLLVYSCTVIRTSLRRPVCLSVFSIRAPYPSAPVYSARQLSALQPPVLPPARRQPKHTRPPPAGQDNFYLGIVQGMMGLGVIEGVMVMG